MRAAPRIVLVCRKVSVTLGSGKKAKGVFTLGGSGQATLELRLGKQPENSPLRESHTGIGPRFFKAAFRKNEKPSKKIKAPACLKSNGATFKRTGRRFKSTATRNSYTPCSLLSMPSTARATWLSRGSLRAIFAEHRLRFGNDAKRNNDDHFSCFPPHAIISEDRPKLERDAMRNLVSYFLFLLPCAVFERRISRRFNMAMLETEKAAKVLDVSSPLSLK